MLSRENEHWGERNVGRKFVARFWPSILEIKNLEFDRPKRNPSFLFNREFSEFNSLETIADKIFL